MHLPRYRGRPILTAVRTRPVLLAGLAATLLAAACVRGTRAAPAPKPGLEPDSTQRAEAVGQPTDVLVARRDTVRERLVDAIHVRNDAARDLKDIVEGRRGPGAQLFAAAVMTPADRFRAQAQYEMAVARAEHKLNETLLKLKAIVLEWDAVCYALIPRTSASDGPACVEP